MNAHTPIPVTGSSAADYLRIQAQHDRVMRGRQMEAIAMWPVADQIALMRQIATDLHHDRTFGRTVNREALIVIDQADELERLLSTQPITQGA